MKIIDQSSTYTTEYELGDYIYVPWGTDFNYSPMKLKIETITIIVDNETGSLDFRVYYNGYFSNHVSDCEDETRGICNRLNMGEIV